MPSISCGRVLRISRPVCRQAARKCANLDRAAGSVAGADGGLDARIKAALQELARAVGEDGSSNIPEQDRTNLAKFLTISRARMDNLVARLRTR